MGRLNGLVSGAATDVAIRAATETDHAAISAVTLATGQHEEWAGTNHAYIGHLMDHGRVVVAELDGKVAGFGATERIGTGAAAISMLCDLFVDPAAHGRGCGRAMLAELWAGEQHRMTFSSLHSHAIPLYTSFGLDAWWPLLYLQGDPGRLPVPGSWAIVQATAEQIAGYEASWTGIDRTADHRAWAGRPGGTSLLVSHGSQVMAACTVAGTPHPGEIVHLAMSPAADDETAQAAVLAVLAQLHGPAHVCLPAPHPAVRALLAADWRFDEFDLFMASELGLLDPRRAVPSPAQA
jgi:GNAT superfamily N-acetyltransferase